MTCEQFAAMFLSMDDDYMRGRAADVKDISERVISILNGSQVSPEAMPEPVIILAEDLAPSETVQFEKDKLLALVTQKGSANSHTAILARTMNIPSLVSTDVEVDPDYDGKMAVVDGFAGLLYIDPDEETLTKMYEKKGRADQQRALLQEMKGKETVTKSRQAYSSAIPISVEFRMWMQYWKMMRKASVCSEASFCIWNAMIIRVRKCSSKPIRPYFPAWEVRKLLSVHWTSVQTNRSVILICRRKKTRHLDIGQSASA